MAFQVLRRRSTPRLDITGLLTDVVSGQLILDRDDRWVTLNFRNLDVAAQGPSYVEWVRLLPPGFRPPDQYTDLPIAQRTDSHTPGPVRIDQYGGLRIYRHTGAINGLVLFKTEQMMPAQADWPGIEVLT